MLFNINTSIKHQSFVYTQLNDQTVLFQTIQCSIIWFGLVLWHINYCKLFHTKSFYTYILNIWLIILNELNLILSQLNGFTYFYLIRILSLLSNSSIWPYLALSLWDRGEKGVMVMKGYPALPKTLDYWSLTIILFIVISRTLIGGVLILYRDAVGVFCSPSWVGP